MIKEDKNECFNIKSKIIRDSIFAHHKHDAHSKSSFKKRRRDSDLNNIYNSFLSFSSTQLFSMIISRRLAHDIKDTHVENTQIKITHIRSTHVRNTHVINTHVEINSLDSSSHILALREKTTITKTKMRTRNTLK
jgi:hypothetical protein